jgi:hypothetical protein
VTLATIRCALSRGCVGRARCRDIRHSSGRRLATRASRPRVASSTWSRLGSVSASPKAPRSALARGAGNRPSRVRTGRNSWWSAANASSTSDSTPGPARHEQVPAQLGHLPQQGALPHAGVAADDQRAATTLARAGAQSGNSCSLDLPSIEREHGKEHGIFQLIGGKGTSRTPRVGSLSHSPGV